MSNSQKINFKSLYQNFDHPVTSLDCGRRCAPYNEYAQPFCCDTTHAIPTAYCEEWRFLQASTDLWHLWQGGDLKATNRLRAQVPTGQVVIECLGHQHCQRPYRSIICRAFPFYPYITRQGEFIGLACYWQYQDRCWVINNLHCVTPQFRQEFVSAFNCLLTAFPSEMESFQHHSSVHRRVFGERKAAIPLLHRDGGNYLVTTRNGHLQQVDLQSLPRHGPYDLAARMPFPDEKVLDSCQ